MAFERFIKLKESELATGFVATLLGSGASKVIFVAVNFVCSNLLAKEQFGELSFIRSTLDMILCICALNYAGICTKFTVEAREDRTSIHKLLWVFLFTLFFCISIGLIFIVTPSDTLQLALSNQTIVSFFRIAGVMLPLFILQPLIEGVLRGLKKFKLIGVVQTVTSVFYLVTIYLGIELVGLRGATIAVILYYSVYSLVCVTAVIRIVPIRNVINKLKGFWNERSVVGKMILPTFVMSFVDAPAYWLNQVILSKYGGMASVGSMVAIIQITNLAILLPNYFVNTFTTFVGEMNAKKQYETYFRRFAVLEKSFWWMGIGGAVAICMLSKPILFLYGKDFVEDWPAMIFACVSIPIIMQLTLLKTDLLLQEHQRELLFIVVGWNVTWLMFLFIFLELSVLPLYAFFLSRALGCVVYLLGVYVVYQRDKNRLMPKNMT